jgi:anthranilate phosphoribosyltransferase
MEYAATLRLLIGGGDLSDAQAYALFGEIMDGAISPVRAAGLLTALAAKGETIDEVVGAARAMRERSLHVEHGLDCVVDVVGTGGDGADTINISTMAALVVAATGLAVAKHGNRAASSACGSADVLEAEGLPLDIAPEVAAAMLRATNFTFMFAPRYHPAMKNVAPVRRELGVRTIFNVLGPLTNPARATHQIVGVARESQLELMGDVLRGLGVEAGAVVHGEDGIDEIGGDAPTVVYSFARDQVKRWRLDPHEYGIYAPLETIRGGTVDRCREAFARILSGELSPAADVVALNAGFVLHACGTARSIDEGLAIARNVLASGRALEVFERAKEASHG